MIAKRNGTDTTIPATMSNSRDVEVVLCEDRRSVLSYIHEGDELVDVVNLGDLPGPVSERAFDPKPWIAAALLRLELIPPINKE